MSNFIISCGGTGGHLAPGIAIGKALINLGHSVTFAISKKEVDSTLVKKYPECKFVKIAGAPFSLNPKGAVKFLFAQSSGLFESVSLLKKEHCDVAISFGGFNSLGVALAAKLLKKKLVFHEANMRIGKAIRFLGRFADRIYIPHGTSIERFKVGIVRFAGYPVRPEIKRIQKNEAKKDFGFEDYEKVLLIFGGSQGAKALNDWLDENENNLKANLISVLCICGPKCECTKTTKYVGSDGKSRSINRIAFCDNMASALSCCELVVARAGAGSIAEFAKCKTVPILVPFPFAADNHQLENAKRLEKSAAAILVRQKDIGRLFNEVKELFFDDSLREVLAKNLSRIDKMNDISAMVEDLSEIAKAR